MSSSDNHNKEEDNQHTTMDIDKKLYVSDTNDNELQQQKQSSPALPVPALAQVQRIKTNPSQSDQQHIQCIRKRLKKFCNFINYHGISAVDIWNVKCPKPLTIVQFANKIHDSFGYYLNNDELTAIVALAEQKDKLKRTDFHQLHIWNSLIDNQEFMMGEQSIINNKGERKSIDKSKNHTNKKSKSLKKNNKNNKENSNTNNNNFIKTNNHFKNQNQNQNHNQNHNQQIKISTPNDQDGQGFFQNHTSKSILQTTSFIKAKKYSQSKAQLRSQELQKDIQGSILQKKWDYLVMAGEMNQWIEQLEKSTGKCSSRNQIFLKLRYKVLNQGSFVKVLQQNLALETQEEIPEIVFMKKHEILKRKMVPEQNRKNNLKGTVILVLNEKDKITKPNLEGRLNQRDQELNFVLLQIMRTKSIFQYQTKALAAAGIN